MILLKFLLWVWAVQLVLAGALLVRYGMRQLRRAISERLAARKVVAVEMENA